MGIDETKVLHQNELEKYLLEKDKGGCNAWRVSKGVEQPAMERRDAGEYEGGWEEARNENLLDP